MAFFAAAHNDDALSGFREGIGLTQGDNALGIAFDLERMDLWAITIYWTVTEIGKILAGFS